jgi:hypothetical protein
MFNELIHIFRTYFITFRYIKKYEINYIKHFFFFILIIYLLNFIIYI